MAPWYNPRVAENDGSQAAGGSAHSAASAGTRTAGDGDGSAGGCEIQQDAPIELGVADDHVAGLTRLRKPIFAIEELIWNALDADATNVSVTFENNLMTNIDRIVVEDDGLGMNPSAKGESFGKLGGSPKRDKPRTPSGRTMHGREGKGRFRAFALGSRVEWVSRYRDTDGAVKEWAIWGDASNLRKFPNTKPRLADRQATGTTVTITNVTAPPTGLTTAAARNELIMRLAPYLRNCPDVTVTFDHKPLDVAAVEELAVEHDLELVGEDGKTVYAKVRIIEWNMEVERRLLLCTPDGFARQEENAGIQAKGFEFTAYVMSDVIAELSEPELSMAEMQPRLRALLDAARAKMSEHFREREADRLRAVVDQWKAEGAYPYEGEPTSPVAQAERDVFDILALNVHQHVKGFDLTSADNKAFTFKLLRQALQTNPASLQTILKQVLDLPRKEQDEFAELLKQTKLSGIIRAAKVVRDRLAFAAGLRELLFEPETKERLKERSQLQKMVLKELWIFGDRYLLGSDDQNLTSLLAAHINILDRETLAEDLQHVRDIDGANRIPDLMLYRRFAAQAEGQFEHLVIELKRPKLNAGNKEIGQIENYAYTVARDPRFDKRKTKWTFMLLVNDVDAFGDAKCQPQPGRQWGHIVEQDHLSIYVKKWASVITEAEWRHEFYRHALDLEMQDADGREYVEAKHAQYLPKPKPNDPTGPRRGGRRKSGSTPTS